MKFEVKNRFTGKVQFIAEIDADETTPTSIKLALAVRWGIENGANLRGANLHGADLSGVPAIKNIHAAVYQAASQPCALDMSQWHTCDTTHCRAGWVVALTGEDGKALENEMGTPAAAALIYLKSDPKLEKIPDFYCDSEEALADMKRLAELEAVANKEIADET